MKLEGMGAHQMRWVREHRLSMMYLYLQVVFFTAALACIIAIVWNPLNWVPFAVTAVLLLFAGGACKSGRQ